MENIAEVMKLIEAGLQNNPAKVFNYSQLLIDKLESNGDIQTAERLKKVIKNNKSITLNVKGYEQVLKCPVDTESRLPLAEVRKYEPAGVLLSLSNKVKDSVEEYVQLINNAEAFSDKGIKINRSLLLFGPPGTGKTQAAKYIAAKTNLPLVMVRIDALVSSYLGNTSKNIRALFDFVEKTPCILFLDEFDAIAKMRDDPNEMGELKRVVNTLLQNIDSIESKVPIIAATNHEHLLDSAVWRRFDYKLKIDLPGDSQRSELIKHYLDDLVKSNKIHNILITMTNKLSGADIEMFCNMIRTNLVFDKQKIIKKNNLLDYFIKFKNRNIKGTEEIIDTNDDNKILLIKSFRQSDKKSFDYRTLSTMTGMSTGKIFGLLKESGDDGK